jgi:hypothetical protein
MFLFDLLFGKARKPSPSAGASGPQAGQAAMSTQPQAAIAPGTRIHHDPRLIEALKEDHQLLLEIFGAIGQARLQGDLMTVQTRLNQFRVVLRDHLLKENVRLYVYLEHLLAGDTISHQLIHEFRHEMDDIGRAVIGFLSQYKEIGLHPELAGKFAADLAGIGEALVARIRREEDTLYPMYMPPV